MSQFIKDLTSLTFTAGSTVSNAITLFEDCRNIGITWVTTSSGTRIVQVSPTATGSTFFDLQSGGNDVTMTASEALVLEPLPFRQLRFMGSTGAGSTGETGLVTGLFIV